MCSAQSRRLSVADLAALGVRRVSVGGVLAWMAWAGVMRAGKDLATGRFDALDAAASRAELDRFFAEDADRRE
jgi:2-methylisocitrate lyase-like PEP mutase family enzyme